MFEEVGDFKPGTGNNFEASFRNVMGMQTG
jgi:hypothetical protein